MKKTALMTAALLGVASFAMLSGFDSAETADSVLEKYVEASKDQKDANAEATFDLDANLGIEEMGMSLAINANGDMPMSFTLDPVEMAISGNFNLNAAGTEIAADMEMYTAADEDGVITTYMKMNQTEDGQTTEGQWEVSKMASNEMAAFTALTQANIDFTDFPSEFTLAPEAADVNGKSCYELTTQMTYDDLKAVLEWAVGKVRTIAEESGQEVTDEQYQEAVDALAQLDQFDPFMTGIVFNITLDIDDTTFACQRVRLDADGSDWATVEAIIPTAMGLTNDDGTPMTCALDVASLYMDIVYDYETPVSIEVPAEAKAAAEGVEVTDIDNLDSAIDELMSEGE